MDQPSTSGRPPLDDWLPDCVIRPEEYTDDYNEGFQSSAFYLLAGLLHSPSYDDLEEKINDLLEGFEVPDNPYYLEAMDQSSTSIFKQQNLCLTNDIITKNTMCIWACYFLHNDVSAELELEQCEVLIKRKITPVEDIARDMLLINALHKVAGIHFQTLEDSLNCHRKLNELWRHYGVRNSFCQGRGSKFMFNMGATQDTFIEDIVNWPRFSFMGFHPFAIYDLGENFSFASIGRGFHHVASVAGKWMNTAAKCWWSSYKDFVAVETDILTEASIKTVTQALEGADPEEAFIANLTRSSIKHAVKYLSPHESTNGISYPGQTAGMVYKRFDNPAYDPRVGDEGVVGTMSANDRTKLDEIGDKFANMAVRLYASNKGRSFLNNQSANLVTFRSFDQSLTENAESVMQGRGPPASENDANEEDLSSWDGFFDMLKQPLVEAAEKPFDINTPETRSTVASAIMLGGNPYVYTPVDEHGDLIDVDDLKEINAQNVKLKNENSDLKSKESELKAQVIDEKRKAADLQRALDIAGVTTMSGGTRYVNWDIAESDELLTAINSKWMDLKDAFELIDTLNECNFKYDTARDSARDQLTGEPFSISLNVASTTRFPIDKALVCQNSQDVVTAISDVLASLNYKNEEYVTGPKDNQAPRKVRATNSYDDAALSFVKSVTALSKVFTKAAMTRQKFERKFGLTWQ